LGEDYDGVESGWWLTQAEVCHGNPAVFSATAAAVLTQLEEDPDRGQHQLRIQLKLNTALLSHCPSVRSSQT